MDTGNYRNQRCLVHEIDDDHGNLWDVHFGTLGRNTQKSIRLDWRRALSVVFD